MLTAAIGKAGVKGRSRKSAGRYLKRREWQRRTHKDVDSTVNCEVFRVAVIKSYDESALGRKLIYLMILKESP